MKLSKKAEYALKALMELAMDHKHGVNVTLINDIAERENIPPRYLEQILLTLKKSGLLTSKRGVGGGYTLNKSSDKIMLGDVIRIIDGPLATLGYASKKSLAEDKDEVSYVLSNVMSEVGSAIKDIMDSISLKEMVKRTLDMIEKKKTVLNYTL